MNFNPRPRMGGDSSSWHRRRGANGSNWVVERERSELLTASSYSTANNSFKIFCNSLQSYSFIMYIVGSMTRTFRLVLSK